MNKIVREHGARDKLINETKRRRIEQMLDAGYSVSKISKVTGITYTHVKQIAIRHQGEKKS